MAKLINDLKMKLLAVLTAIRANGGNISAKGLFMLIRKTSELTAPQIVVLHNYTSDKSDNTELADYVMNIGTKYENAKDSSLKKLADLDLSDLAAIAETCTPATIKGYQYINRKGLTDAEYCTAVKNELPTALAEMQTVTDRPNDNVIHINSVLSYNSNTGNLLISGELVKGGKTTKIEGEPKLTAKAPKTVAKEMIRAYLNTRTSKIRQFNITNLNEISIGGEKITLVPIG